MGIEYVRGGHVGGENNKNIFAWELNFFPKENSFIVLLLQHGRRAHTLLVEISQSTIRNNRIAPTDQSSIIIRKIYQ